MLYCIVISAVDE